MTEGTRQVAIVGQGPKGLFALERLIARATQGEGGPMRIDIFEPHRTPGAGPNYDPSQPGYLLMNFDAERINMWPDDMGPSYLSWCESSGTSPQSYPSRADVGRYLGHGFATLVERAGDDIVIELHPMPVHAVEPSPTGWRVLASGDSSEHDEVLLALGHSSGWEGRLTTVDTAGTPVVPAVFPVHHWLSHERVPPGAKVGLRGFALTAIDACLALTEGRGGSFVAAIDPYNLDYRSGPDEVSEILPFTRTGRPMLAKPDPRRGPQSSELDRVAEAGRAEVREAHGVDALTRVVEQVAERSLAAVTGHSDATRVLDVLRPGLDPTDQLERSLSVAVGKRAPDREWAIGHAWRSIYPAIVERFSRDGLAPGQWSRFRALASEMERVSFGPPPENVAKLLALMRAGKLSMACLQAGPAELGADVILDAVLPPPGAAPGAHPLLERLVREGHARLAQGRRGLELTADVTCVDASGKPSRGLGAIGRPTEDWIIGNDTLSRHLHSEPDIWAQRVLAGPAA